MLRPTVVIRKLLCLLALATAGSAALSAQSIEECERRECVRAPCVQPPCRPIARREWVERTGREVRIALDGRVLRYVVTEQWTNRGHTIGEADYVLPLPKGAAFEDLALEIDGELVTGEALGADRARRIYEEIVRQKKDPALVEWMGMGVLRTRIFPIQPGETRTVVVRFRAVAEREGEALRVDVPAPRGAGTAGSGTDISMRWPTGEGFGEPWSPTHRVRVEREGVRRIARVADANGTVTLLVPVRSTRGAAISVLTHAPREEDGYALITLTPPVMRRAAQSRDVTFVIDVSGSMAGVKLAQAKAAGKQLLNSLETGDRFRLIAFASEVDDFREGWSATTSANRREAQRWLDGLRANGGTNIAGALERALERDGRDSRDSQEAREPWESQTSRGRLALVLFMTDGAPTVGERRAERISARAATLRGDRRVFTFGVGADLNAALVEQLALEGGGTAHFVRPEEDVERVVGVVAQRLTRPVATNLRVRAEGVRLNSVQPAGVVDLFAGQELVLLARYNGSSSRGRIIVTGETPEGRVTWEGTASFPERRTSDAFVGRLWATQRVGWLSAERRKQGPSRELDAEMRELGERWGIPTELTSYLVLEPGMQLARSGQGAAMDQVVVTGSSSGLAGGQASGARTPTPAGTAPAAVQAGDLQRRARSETERAFEAAKSAATMRESRSMADIAASPDDATSRRTNTRQFVMRDGTWTDTRAAGKEARTLRMKPFSAAYFAAMERIAELREAFALGERVEVHGRALTILLADDGVEILDAAALLALTRDW